MTLSIRNSTLLAASFVVAATACASPSNVGSDQTTIASEDCIDQGDCAAAPEPTSRGESSATSLLDALSKTPTSPSTQDTYKGVSVGFTEDGYPYMGNPDAAVSLIEYSDYQCPFCARHYLETEPALIELYFGGDDVNMIYRDFPLVSIHAAAPAASSAALCVSEQGAAVFWTMHDALFDTQSQWSALGDPLPFLATLAEQSGAEPSAYGLCMAQGRVDTLVDQSVTEALELGFNATPTFQLVDNATGGTTVISGAYPIDTFVAAIDAVVAGEDPNFGQPSDNTQAFSLPFWASADGLAPDPTRPGFTAAGDPYKGNPAALLVIVEFGDFQCPACAQHALEIQPTLDELFVDSGDVMFVFKNLPLTIHPQAPAAAVAAECAGYQGAFWEMEHLLFERLGEWTVPEPDAVLLDLAAQLGLDGPVFEACLSSRQALERVLEDVNSAEGTVRSTPSFILLGGGEARLIEGALAVDDFVRAVEQLLVQAQAGN